jgi:hypothetical protein
MHEDGSPYGTPGYYHVNTPASQWYIHNGGWKIHLTVLPKNYAKVDEWLDKNCPGQYKLLSGGVPGEKDFTIYIGKKDNMIKFAKRILEQIEHLLEYSKADFSDKKIFPKIAARFVGTGKSKNFTGISGLSGDPSSFPYYGNKGIPYDDAAQRYRNQVGYAKLSNTSPGQIDGIPADQYLANHERKLSKALEEQYGEMYTGTGENIYLRKKKSSKPKQKRKIVKKTKRVIKKCKCKK